jgi:uncharacterized protein
MDVNPFPYQRPVAPAQLIDRDVESARLVADCEAGTLTRIDAPRRYGKTSLVRKLFAEADKRGTVGVLVDLKGVLTLEEVTIRIGLAYAELQGPFRRRLERWLAAFQVDFGVTVLGTGGHARLARREQSAEAALFALLGLPVTFSADGWRQVIVCFDEFQDAFVVPAADDKIRSQIQHHPPEQASYLFTGSQPRLMNELFGDKRRAFWSQADRLELSPLETSICADYIAARFEETGRDAGSALGNLLALGQGHPQRTMLLASKLWRRTARGAKADRDTWEAALVDAKFQVEPELDAEWRALKTTEQRVLRAAVRSDGRPYRRAAAEAVGLAVGSVDTAVEGLVDDYVVRRVESGVVAFVDPLFELYVRDLAESSLPAGEPGIEGE